MAFVLSSMSKFEHWWSEDGCVRVNSAGITQGIFLLIQYTAENITEREKFHNLLGWAVSLPNIDLNTPFSNDSFAVICCRSHLNESWHRLKIPTQSWPPVTNIQEVQRIHFLTTISLYTYHVVKPIMHQLLGKYHCAVLVANVCGKLLIYIPY